VPAANQAQRHSVVRQSRQGCQREGQAARRGHFSDFFGRGCPVTFVALTASIAAATTPSLGRDVLFMLGRDALVEPAVA